MDNLLHSVANGICLKDTTGPDLIKKQKIIVLSAASHLALFWRAQLFNDSTASKLKWEAGLIYPVETAEDATEVFIECNYTCN